MQEAGEINMFPCLEYLQLILIMARMPRAFIRASNAVDSGY